MTKAETATTRIEEIKSEQARQLAELDAKIRACEDAQSGLDAKIEAAAASENLDAWNKANFEKSSAAAKIKMLQRKREQVTAFDFVGQDETDKMINELIERENELDALISKTVLTAIEKINAAYESYRGEIDETTIAIKQVIREIRPYQGEKFASKFVMSRDGNKDIQKYESGRDYPGNWTDAAYIARDFLDRAADRADKLKIIANAADSKRGK